MTDLFAVYCSGETEEEEEEKKRKRKGNIDEKLKS